VDDDPHIRRLIIAALKREGYVFAEAANGREALDEMRANENIRLVVLDLMMPLVSGWDVLQERQKEPRLQEIPVILISANRGPEIAEAVDKGICAFLPTPFDIGSLNALVKGCLAPDSGT
jgi:CheY-like chemotaxis protein